MEPSDFALYPNHNNDTTVEFRSLVISCSHCVVFPMCKDKVDIERKLEQKNMHSFFLGLEKWDERLKFWGKGLIEAWINMGCKFINSYCYDDLEHNNPRYASYHHRRIILYMTQILGYIIFSPSWGKGTFIKSDKEEIIYKFKNLIELIEKM